MKLLSIPAHAGIFVLHRKYFFAVLLITVIPLSISAQTINRFERPISAPVFFIASQDTFLNINEDSLIAASLPSADTTIREGKSTTIATLGSMVLPGFGQIYNQSYWKAPVVWGLEYYFYSVYHHQDKLYKESKAAYDTTITASDPEGSANARNLRDFYRNQRNLFGWYMVITYVLNVVDAYVDAALFNFEVSPNLQGTNEMRLRMSIPLR